MRPTLATGARRRLHDRDRHEPISVEVFEHAGIDVAVNPRSVTAEEIVRFAHDPRIRQLAMLEGDRFEILDITVREESKLVRIPFRELPMTGSLIGAIVRGRNGDLPARRRQLEPDDRAIIFTESAPRGRGREGALAVRFPRPRALGVDVGSAVNLVGAVLKYLGAAFLFPAAIGLAEGEPVWPFLASALITSGSGLALERGTRGTAFVGPREGFLVVALIWLALPVFGALPYLLADEPQLARPVDAYFEAMSGFTATGATLLTDIEAVDSSLLMWRQFTQWLGGMGIIVLAVAILPRLRVGGRQLLQSELAGPDRGRAALGDDPRDGTAALGALPRATLTAIAVFTLYGWTGADPAMNLYQATAQAFSTLAIGGFSTQNESVAAFAAVTQWTIVVFLVLAGINFLRLYLVLVRGQVRAVARDDEFRLYLAFLGAGAVLLLTGAGRRRPLRRARRPFGTRSSRQPRS